MVDYHIHTNFSDGEVDYKTVIDLAAKKGLEAIAITDHFDKNDSNLRNQFATEEELLKHFSNIKEYAAGKPVKVFCGVETCTDFDGRLNLSERIQKICDVIITSPHYVEYDAHVEQEDYFNKAYWDAYKQKLLHMAAGKGDVLGHPEGYLPIGKFGTGNTTYESRQKICREICERFFDRDFIDELGNRLVKSQKSYELHCATFTPRETVISRLAEKGVTFSIGSDAHAMNILGETEWAYKMVRKYNLILYQPEEKTM